MCVLHCYSLPFSLMLRCRGRLNLHWGGISWELLFMISFCHLKGPCDFWCNTSWNINSVWLSVRLLVRILWRRMLHDKSNVKTDVWRPTVHQYNWRKRHPWSQKSQLSIYLKATYKVSVGWAIEVLPIGLCDPAVDGSRQISMEGCRVSGLI